MVGADASAVLDLWEEAMSAPLPKRALAMLAYGYPDARPSDLGALPLGMRDALLVQLRRRLFGNGLSFVTTCPVCGVMVESSLDLSTMSFDAPNAGVAELQLPGGRIRVRAPTAADLLNLPSDAESARRALVSRCLVAHSDAELVASLSPSSLGAIGAAMAGADPEAVRELALECPDCTGRWSTALDIASFLWREIDAWARRTLRDVHALARAYAWSEREVLALSPTRRQLYLDLSRP